MSEVMVKAAARGDRDALAFPKLNDAELDALRPMAVTCEFADGETIVKAGQGDIDLLVVESGGIRILNPFDNDSTIVIHRSHDFAGDIDMLTRRPIIVTMVADGHTRLLRVPGPRLREMLTKVPTLSEKMLIAFQERRRLLELAGVLGLRVVGPGKCRDTMRVREFLFKNFVPFTWYEPDSDQGRKLLEGWGSPRKSPVIECAPGKLLINPTLRELAEGAGVWRHCPSEQVDLAIVGAGPSGMAAAVYAASEGLNTLVLDKLGPGGQASGSSKIENFIGFPAGLTGAELATRSVLQMLKFGAKIVAPVEVQQLTPALSPEDCHLLQLNCGTKLRTKTVLISAGVRWRRLAAEGAERFESAGIHYACTTVEATLYDSLDVAVVGAGNSAGQAAMFLSECCPNRKVHLIIRRTLGPQMSEYLVNRIQASPNIVVREGVEISVVSGRRRLESVTLRAFTGDGNVPAGNGRPEIVPIGAAFVFIGAEPGCDWLPEAIARDELGYILTGIDALRSGRWPLKDREPCPLETTIPGVLAAGDIRSGSTKRVGFAVGDGSLAVTCVHKLIAIRT